ncbi:lipopolysaccharide biosynthesis protein RfbH [uncultured Methanomethylovorans sp.]|uniref:lipopolysaccharide biosynthesis protein RfbH n=1 Tax=uncultured Methanomethylovorans sp. TaxID=183759 RepID=UPI002AA75EA1|nr:lipopolysaccharide biosynthesis protein RfbH [uncultured Methanomethylovorans sp.]
MGINELKNDIYENISQIVNNDKTQFVPGESPVLTGMAVYDHKEINAIIGSLLDGWFGLGKKGVEFEKRFSSYICSKYGILVNSGSSANLIALNSIKNKLNLHSGEIITPACAFPTSFNAILQLGFTPAIIDVDESLNITPESVISAINENTKGIMFAHTLGNPAQIEEIAKIAAENDLFIVEDCCDALGSKYNNKICGTFGTISTYSFYPAHGITMGEGGCLVTNDHSLSKISKSLRDWGRDCWCTTDEKNILGSCGRRFDYEIDGIPYDHKYIYSTIGYNLKPLELQAAMGLEQLNKLDEFNRIRKNNFKCYSDELEGLDNYIEIPTINKHSDPVFFGMPLVINNEKVKRQDLIKYLNSNKIATRYLFGGNLLKQPAYENIKYSLYGQLDYTNNLMKNCFWIGIHPGIDEEMIKYVVGKLREFFTNI